MNIATLACENLGRRPLRSVLTLLGIAVAVASFVVMVGLSQGIERAWVDNLHARGTDLLVVQKGAVEILTTSLDESLGQQIGAADGVADVAAELGDLMTLENGQTTVAVGWSDGCFLWRAVQLQAGRLPAGGERDAVLLGESAAAALGKAPGDTVLARGRTFTVAGIFKLGGVMGNNAVVLPLASMQALTGRPGQVTGFHVRVRGGGEPATLQPVKAALALAFPDLTFLESDAAADNDLVLRLFRAVAWSLSVIANVIALLVILNTLVMSVMERTREIGILSAVGWPTARVLRLLVLEGLLLALVGEADGAGLGAAGRARRAARPRVRGVIEGSV